MKIKQIAGISPFGVPDVNLACTLLQAGVTSILDLGQDPKKGCEAMQALAEQSKSSFGIRISANLYTPNQILPSVTLIVFDTLDFLKSTEKKLDSWRQQGREIWLQVCSVQEAKEAWLMKPDALIFKGSESGNSRSDSSSFILLQEAAKLNVPFWIQGGIGFHSAAACITAGAKGVVIDAQLSLLKECSLQGNIKQTIAHWDGTDKVAPEYQMYHQPDIGLASAVAEKYQNVLSFVKALQRAVQKRPKQAAAVACLQPGSAMAKANGTRFPLAQGPMTRVSDQSEFIYSVAENGALPFLALSLMDKQQSREILLETADRLGKKPWGVGILGFAPEEVRVAQLQVLEDFKPSALLIAGGTFSQTLPFEARGIRTFLHVTSPILLKSFLKEGARRFVFEGRECGGHVGPRSSFLLWELQIQILLDFEFLHEVEVFFAGGVHDAVSGAVVAAMAAPLAARGAKIGALIGTAYLFTEEAVASGAILPQFQKEAIACKQTALLESSPGHAVRCAITPFVNKFETQKKNLQAAGSDPKVIWAELEKLNIGKLRIASKGLERLSDKLVNVDEVYQREEGLFMLGQVAELRNKTCTMLSLHKDISEGSTEFLAACQRGEWTPTSAGVTVGQSNKAEDIAIIGMACIFPGSKNLNQYWDYILNKKSAVVEVPEDRWEHKTYYAEKAGQGGKSISKWGAFLDEFDFDPLEFGIPPNVMESIEPVQLLSLKVAKDALADAGYADKEFDREKTSVIFGAETGTELSNAYNFRALFPHYVGEMPKELDEFLPKLTEESFPGVLANVITGRIANRFDLGGSNYTVDAACASSLAALDLSVKELQCGESDMVLCGGADLHNSINDYLMFSSVKALSATGKIQPFSADADGIVLGEGIAVVVLKRLSDAVKDGDRIYSVIKAVGSSSDGKNLGLTAPSKNGQVRALDRTYKRAQVSPAEIELIEAHGTGTVLGDRTELETMTEVFFEAGARVRGCALGSVKSQIGHTKCAAGLAGLIKTSLALYHGVVPPTLHTENPNPFYKRDASPFFFTGTPLPWLTPVRKAAVSAFGFGGTNFHTVLTSYAGKNRRDTRATQLWPAELFLFASEDEVKNLSKILQQHAELDLARLAKTYSARSLPQVYLSLVAHSVADLCSKIEQLLKGEDVRGAWRSKVTEGDRGKLAFLFSGQGSQSINMGAELFTLFPHLRKYLQLGEKWLPSIYPRGIGKDSEKNLTRTSVAQPALGMLELALYQLAQDLQITPHFYAGHSYGEVVAFCLAGGCAVEDLLNLSEARGLAIEKAATGIKGSMAAVFADYATTAAVVEKLSTFSGRVPDSSAEAPQESVDATYALVREETETQRQRWISQHERALVVANHNAPLQCVISGADVNIDLAVKEFTAKGIRCVKIPVACAFHSPLLKDAEGIFEKVLCQVKLSAPNKTLYSNNTGKEHPTFNNNYEASIYYQKALARQVVEPVQFVKQIEQMYADGARTFIEVGPGGILTNLISHILKDKPHYVQTWDRCSNAQATTAVEKLLWNLAELTSVGVTLNPAILFAERQVESYDLSKLQAEAPAPKSQTLFLVNGYRARPKFGAAPKKLTKLTKFTAGDSRETVAKEFLISMRQIVETERQVMLQFLGSEQKQVTLAQDFAAEAVVIPTTVSAEPVVEQVLNTSKIILKIVSQKTGYPTDMLGLDQDLESDLGIGSIKRFEIIADIKDQLKINAQPAAGNTLEKFTTAHTLRKLIALFEEQVGAGSVTLNAGQGNAGMDPVVRGQRDNKLAPVSNLNQYSLNTVEVPLSQAQKRSFKDCSVGIMPDQKGLAAKLGALFTAAGASVTFIKQKFEANTKPLDYLICMSPLSDDALHLREVFAMLQAAVRGNTKAIVGITAFSGQLGSFKSESVNTDLFGISGLFKSLAREYQDKTVKLINLNPFEAQEQLAQNIFTELAGNDALVEVGYENGVRKAIVASPYTPGAKQKELVELNKDSVILMLGGASGIAALIAVKLAEKYSCKFEIVGRTPREPVEANETRALAGLTELRAHFIAQGKFKSPVEIEAQCKKILKRREIESNISKLEQWGSKVTYQCFDVRSKEQLTACLAQIYAKGKIDGVIHAAGIVSDSLLLDKSEETFAQVFETKMNPMEVLTQKLQKDVKFVALFSSVSGCFGNRGQTDYAAGNNAMEQHARILGENTESRIFTVNWGPWAEIGMVSAEVQREYEKKGIGLIAPQAGAQFFLDELIFGDPAVQQLVVMNGSPEKFDLL